MQYNKMIVLLGLLLSAFANNCVSQGFDKQKVDQYIQNLSTRGRFMGKLVVFKQNKKVYSNSIGFANIGARVQSGDETMYRVGSISKTITASLVLRAVEEGKIKLTDSIKGFFPSVEHAGQITIEQLLNHHSGIHNFTGGNFMSWNTQYKSRHDLVDSIAKGGSDFLPGSKALYSNSNYVLLSFILEDLYHKPYAAIVHERIAKPLKLKHFQVGDKATDLKTIAHSYFFEAGWNSATETDLSIPMGAGAIVSNAEDLAILLNALFQGKLISTQMLEKMEEQSDGYGLGLFKKQLFEKTAYTHDGIIDAFNSYFYYFPQDQTLYILLSNANDGNLETVNNSILSVIFNRPIDLPLISSYSIAAKDLDLYTGTYTSQNSSLIIDISGRNNYLLAQPYGQKVYTMEATDKNKFLHEKTGVVLEFNLSNNEMVMKQGQQKIVFRKQ